MRRWEGTFARGKYLLGAAAVALLATAGVANADGMAKGKGVAMAAPGPMSWSGIYFGVHSGYAWADTDNVYAGGGGSWSVGHDTSIYGGQIGIQHQFGALVLGLEASLSSAFQDDGNDTQCPNPATRCHANFDDVITVGPRLGWANGKYMPYLTGGFASARFSDKVTLIATGTPTFAGSERHTGWYIGGGVDYAIAQDWTVGIEYRHYDFDDETYTRHSLTGPPIALADIGEVSPSLDTITLRMSWKWGRPDRDVVPLK